VDAARSHDNQPIGIATGEIEVVNRCQYGSSAPRHAPQTLHHLDLPKRVEIGDRLIEK